MIGFPLFTLVFHSMSLLPQHQNAMCPQIGRTTKGIGKESEKAESLQ